ncbi:16S rRNA (cytosine(1402)-N(4))-methyltransferase RsmH [Fumia xinanensis]|uniref:Ribosomal RNA small subunit methyltransferase H n=1 Tax=Fumia xinanensis TaxID=2763659 RepID=A0A926E697_9FIRM|nr:16S rRNA (cytosine(1402)-N(4))-methyltransferase RsmH [Fumia xinanensis]MBC8559961.1 16S rRNA (cytosine(1402)-N(4))-methyltransferase RsmH [Fumia xinanensis]
MEFSHYPVMLSECMEGLNIREDGIYVDGTAGGGGHSSEIAKRLTTGRLFSLDQDPDAVKAAGERLRPYPQAQVIRTNFKDMTDAILGANVQKVDGVLLDLGVSSYQLDTAERGFSYQKDAPLDMRMSQSGISARDVVNTYSVDELSRILREYGEEKFAYNIAKNIVRHREESPIETTFQLSEIIKASVPAASRREKNPCKRSFQAIRIAVNSELDVLSGGIDAAFDLLNIGGRLVIITFHSLEDRMVKQKFAELCKGCTCPPEFPICVCHNEPKAKLINRKPILPTREELETNRRSQSAKLRILEKCKERI